MKSNNILGISAGFHDAAATVISPTGDILFASHSERFTGQKHDPNLCSEIIDEAQNYGDIGTVAYYENHWLKKFRQLRAGQPIDQWNWTLRGELAQHFESREYVLNNAKVTSSTHHKSHAAAGFQTSPFKEATVVVIDAIGESETISIWTAKYDRNGNAKYKLKWRQLYPHSIGMFYSAMTESVGLRPNDEEYILMGMAAYGMPGRTIGKIKSTLIETLRPPRFKENLHIGVDAFHNDDITKYDVAAGTQELAETMIQNIMVKSKQYGRSNNLVFMGGVALNCSANRHLGKYYDGIWIMPSPGDAGSSLGAAALAYGKKLNWTNAFLGYNIEGEYPAKNIVRHILNGNIAGVANGRAEFGPRSLGNRSILADPRGADIKDKVNSIKQRQKFRPFAPMILAEHAEEYFDMPTGFERSDYMQVIAQCKKPNAYPAIVHKDGTSRVQTVPKDDSGVRKMLEIWYHQTGCPMLLNTSLNVRGQPIVNDITDVHLFESTYGIKVFTKSSPH